MTLDRIYKLANYFYSKGSSCKLSLSCGRAGFDIDRERFNELMEILSNSTDIDSDMVAFLDKISGGYRGGC